MTTSYIDHLARDLAGSTDVAAPSSWVQGSFYEASNDQARVCLQYALYADRIYGGTIKGWTDSALKSFDALLIYYIQDVRGEIIRKPEKMGQERATYTHLQGCNAELAKVGAAFHAIYQQRNRFTHVLQVEQDGRVTIVRTGAKQYRKAALVILEHFRVALRHLDRARVVEASGFESIQVVKS